MDKALSKRLVNVLRDLSIKTPQYAKVLRDSKVKVLIGNYKNGNPKFKVKFNCFDCKNNFHREQVQVDHIIEVGQFDNWSDYIDRLFCNEDGLQVICTKCHLYKTNKFMHTIRSGAIYL